MAKCFVFFIKKGTKNTSHNLQEQHFKLKTYMMNYHSSKFHSENGLPRAFWYICPVGEEVVHATDNENVRSSMFYHANGHSDISKGPFMKYVDLYAPAKKASSKQTRPRRKRKNGKKIFVAKQNSVAEDLNFHQRG